MIHLLKALHVFTADNFVIDTDTTIIMSMWIKRKLAFIALIDHDDIWYRYRVCFWTTLRLFVEETSDVGPFFSCSFRTTCMFTQCLRYLMHCSTLFWCLRNDGRKHILHQLVTTLQLLCRRCCTHATTTRS